MRHRNLIATVAASAALLAPAAALGATPQQIFADAADGHVSGHYSNSDLQRAQHDSTLQGYGNPIVQITIRHPAPAPKPTFHQQTRTVVTSQGLPFTGSHLATFVSLGLVLLSGGLLLRLMARRSTVR